MARPSKNTDQRLIQAARELLPETGCRDLNLRQVAKKANVNLGMFHYHFKTKKRFIRQVIQGFYNEFYSDLTRTVSQHQNSTPQEKLHFALGQIAEFGKNNRKLLLSLLKDVLDGNREVILLLSELVKLHSQLFLKIIQECKIDSVSEKEVTAQALALLIQTLTHVNAPTLALAVLERIDVKMIQKLPRQELEKTLMSDEFIQRRIAESVELLMRRSTWRTS